MDTTLEHDTELKRVLKRHYIFTTIVTWSLIAASVVGAVLVYNKLPFLSGFLIALIPWNIQNWYEFRPSKYLRGRNIN